MPQSVDSQPYWLRAYLPWESARSPTESTDKEPPAWSHTGPYTSKWLGHVIATALCNYLLLKHLSRSWGSTKVTPPHWERSETQSSGSVCKQQTETREVSHLSHPTAEHMGNTGAEKHVQGCVTPVLLVVAASIHKLGNHACPLLQLCVGALLFLFLSPDEHFMQWVQILSGSNLNIWDISQFQCFHSGKGINNGALKTTWQ